MNGLIMAAQLILGLSILVTLHELGHFLAARAFGIKVEKFYLFFDAWNVKLFSFTKGETEYGIGWLPLGGYVKIAGMVDESLDTEKLAQEPQPWEFRAKPAWQRLIVMVAGVTMNVILGIIIFSMSLLEYKEQYLPTSAVNNGEGIYAYKLGRNLGLQNGDKIVTIDGKPFERFEDVLSTRVLFGANLGVERNGQMLEVQVPDDFYQTISKSGRFNFVGVGPLQYEVQGVTPNEPAAKAGILVGDKIISVEGKKIVDSDDLKDHLSTVKGGVVNLTLLRDNKEMVINCSVTEKGTVGVAYQASSQNNTSYALKNYTLSTAFKYGTSDAMEALVSNAKGLGKVFTGKEKATDSVQGPIGIAQIYGGSWDWVRFWGITGLLSMVLAFMNMLPIPALDGGHVIFLTIESITGVKFSDKFMERAQVVGMVILLSLMAFAIGNDIWKHILN